MKKYTIIIILAVFTYLMCNSSNYKQSPKYYRDVYLPKLKLSKESVESLRVSYVEKAKHLISNFSTKPLEMENNIYDNLTSKGNILDRFEFFRININKYKEFKDCGVDLFNVLFQAWRLDEATDFQIIEPENYFYYGVILSGIIIKTDSRIIDSTIGKYSVKYDLKLDTIIKGEYLLDSIPNSIQIDVIYDLGSNFFDDRETKKNVLECIDKIVETGEKVILYVNYHSSVEVYENLKKGYMKVDGFYDLYPWTENPYSFIADMIYKNMSKKLNIQDIIDFYHKLEEINDTPNFYNRRYK